MMKESALRPLKRLQPTILSAAGIVRRARARVVPALTLGIVLSFAACIAADDKPRAATTSPRLLMAVASLRNRERHPQVDLYEHDGIATGQLLPGIPPVDKRSDHHPQLTSDGKQCVYCFEVEGQVGQLAAWDIEKREAIELPNIHAGDQAHMAPSIDAIASLIVFEAWRRPGSPGRWDLLLYDRTVAKTLELSPICTTSDDERKPAMSADGDWVAFTTNSSEGAGATDIQLWSRGSFGATFPKGVNSPAMDTEPSLSRDGRWMAFVSDRPGGEGARDVYLFDLVQQSYLPLAGLNSPGQEQSPFLSADGRYLAFVSERLDGAGERDVYLYDIAEQKLLPTPGLNSFRDEYDPCVIVLPE